MDYKKPTTMQEAVVAFREYLTVEKDRRPRTVASYIPVVESLVEFLPQDDHGDTSTLSTVRRADLSRFLQEQARSSGGGASSAVWNVRLAAIRAFFDYLFKQEVIDVNPALRIERQKVKRPERFPLDLNEMISLVQAVEAQSPKALKTRNVAIIQVFIHCGLRVHEVAGLELAQVDLKGRHLLNVRTKGGKSLSCHMNDVVAEALENYLRLDRDCLAFPEEVPELFLSRDGRPLSIRAVQDLVSEYAGRAGIARRVTPHILRHSSATELVEDLGFDIRTAQRFLGHESVKTTEIYVHAGRREPQKAADALGVAWKERLDAAV